MRPKSTRHVVLDEHPVFTRVRFKQDNVVLSKYSSNAHWQTPPEHGKVPRHWIDDVQLEFSSNFGKQDKVLVA